MLKFQKSGSICHIRPNVHILLFLFSQFNSLHIYLKLIEILNISTVFGFLLTTVKSRFYVSRFYVKIRIYVENSEDKNKSLLNSVSQFYVTSRFYDAFTADQQYRKIEIFKLKLHIIVKITCSLIISYFILTFPYYKPLAHNWRLQPECFAFAHSERPKDLHCHPNKHRHGSPNHKSGLWDGTKSDNYSL